MLSKVITSGPEKAGNHALVKAVELLGIPCDVEHRRYKEGLPVGAKHLFIKRDPRNMVLSMLRFRDQPVSAGMWIRWFRRYSDKKSLIKYLADFESWLNHERTFVVTFEDLIKDDRAIKDIAKYLAVPYLEGSFELLPGVTKTWTGVLSDFHVIWTPEVEKVWNSEGGPELLRTWQYE